MIMVIIKTGKQLAGQFTNGMAGKHGKVLFVSEKISNTSCFDIGLQHYKYSITNQIKKDI